MSHDSQFEELMHGCERAPTEGEGEQIDEPAWKSTATERVMVAFDSRPHAREVLRSGWRRACGLKAPLLAVTVITQPGLRASGSASAEAKARDEQIRCTGRHASCFGGGEVARITLEAPTATTP